jgi:hypothetical protein
VARKTNFARAKKMSNWGRPPRQIIVQHPGDCRGCHRIIDRGSAAWWSSGIGLACMNCGPS